jgi:hypothetical protein
MSVEGYSRWSDLASAQELVPLPEDFEAFRFS